MHTRPSISTETMELPLASGSDCKVWSVIRFLRGHSETGTEIHRQISAVYDEVVMIFLNFSVDFNRNRSKEQKSI